MFKKIKVLALLLAIAVHGLGYAITSAPAPAAAPTPVAQQLPQQAKEPSPSVEVLQAQLEQMRSFQDAILNTVWWSLGVVVVIAFALVSFSWWNNSRNYDRDKNAIRDEISNKLGNMLVEHQERVNERLLEAEKDFADRFNSLTDSVRNRVDDGIEKSSNAHVASLEALKNQLKDFQLASNRQLISQRFDSLEVRHMVHQNAGRGAAAIIVLSELLSLALKRGDFWVERTLDFLSSAIKSFEDKKLFVAIEQEFIDSILDSLVQIPDTLRPMGDALSARLKAVTAPLAIAAQDAPVAPAG